MSFSRKPSNGFSPEVIGLGESLIQLNAVTKGPLRHVNYFERHVAGAETNVVVCARRLGVSSGLITRVGDDEFGKCIINWVRGEGVDVSQVVVDPEAPTGIYFVQRGFPIPGKSRMFYYRKGSAGSRLSPSDVNPEYVSSAKIIHLTGITPALSETARAAVEKAIDIAVSSDVKISFDTNIRPVLWKSSEDAVKTLTPMIKKATFLFTDTNDASLLLGMSDLDEAAKALFSFGVEVVVFKMGEKGAVAVTKKEKAHAEALPVQVEDPIGAGDAFAGTFIASWLKNLPLTECLRRASIAGSLVVTVRGDQECLPSEEDLRANMHK